MHSSTLGKKEGATTQENWVQAAEEDASTEDGNGTPPLNVSSLREVMSLKVLGKSRMREFRSSDSLSSRVNFTIDGGNGLSNRLSLRRSVLMDTMSITSFGMVGRLKPEKSAELCTIPESIPCGENASVRGKIHTRNAGGGRGGAHFEVADALRAGCLGNDLWRAFHGLVVEVQDLEAGRVIKTEKYDGLHVGEIRGGESFQARSSGKGASHDKFCQVGQLDGQPRELVASSVELFEAKALPKLWCNFFDLIEGNIE